MNNTNGKQFESLKYKMDGVSKDSKEAIKSVIESNTRQFDSAIETNKKTFDEVSKMLYEKEMDPSIVSSFKSTFGKSIKVSEDAIDAIIDAHANSIDLSIDFTNKFMDVIQNENMSTEAGRDKLAELIKNNLEQSAELLMQNMEKIIATYNNHLNIALNFNKKFADNMNDQITSMFKLQQKSINHLFDNDMMTEWWKSTRDESVKA